MRVLVTGHRGKVGRQVLEDLERCGHAVVGFDLADGADLLDLAAVKRAAARCAAIVHLGALAHDTAGSPEEIMAVNVLGTWHVLLAAQDAGTSRVVHFSSAPSLELAGRLAPSVPVRDPARYTADPWRALIDCSAAEAVLGWQPRYRWSERGQTLSSPST